jgi:hypothetical protein
VVVQHQEDKPAATLVPPLWSVQCATEGQGSLVYLTPSSCVVDVV